MKQIVKPIILVLVAVVALFTAVFVALGVKSPTIDASKLPKTVPLDQPVLAEVKINDAHGRPLTLTVDPPDVTVTEQGGNWRLSWPEPTPGRHVHYLKLLENRDGKDIVIHTVTWELDVTDGEPPAANGDGDTNTEPVAATDEPPATEPAVVEPPATEPPATEPAVVEPPATEPPATEPAVVVPPAVEPPAVEPPAVAPPLPKVAKLADEIHVQLAGKTKLYGRGVESAGPAPASYVKDKLAHVDFRYAASDDKLLADRQIDALLEVGGELIQGKDPLGVPLDGNAMAAVVRKGAGGVKLPTEVWGVVLRTTSKVAGVVNSGKVVWRLGSYEPDPSSLAVDIRAQDVTGN